MTTATAPDDHRLLPLSHAAELFGEAGAPACKTLRAWIGTGTMINGRRVRLKALKLGQSWFISPAMVREFGEQCAAASLGDRGERPDVAALRQLPTGIDRRRRRLNVEEARRRNAARGVG